MIILDGKKVAEERREQLKVKVLNFQAKAGRAPHLTVVLVGDNPASQVYVRNKIKACESVGINSETLRFPATMTQKQLETEIQRLNENDNVDGVLVQLPLPKGLDDSWINANLNPLKDADGFTFGSLGRLWSGHPLVAPCTPQGVMTLLSHYGISVAGRRACVVGRSSIVGKPMAHLLTMADATVTICHSKTPALSEHTRAAEIVIVAAGRREFLGRDDFQKGAVIVDVGMHGSGQGQGLAGDVRYAELQDWASAATPVPGGVGPMTIATLLENTVTLAEARLQGMR